MSSILKVNTIQDGGGNAIITSDGSGTFTSNLPNTGITMLDQWRLTSALSLSGNATTAITANLERNQKALVYLLFHLQEFMKYMLLVIFMVD